MTKRTLPALFLLAGLLAGCADGGAPAGPESAPRAGAAPSGAPDLTKLARYKSGGPGILIGFAASTIGPAGGTIRLVGFEVVVPPGAVTRPERFTIRLHVDDQFDDYVAATFGPHGQRFLVPVTIRAPYEGTTAESEKATIVWWDGAKWVPFPSILTRDARIESATTHFSDYGVQLQSGVTVDGG